MKWPQTQYNILRDAFRQLVDSIVAENPSFSIKAFLAENPMRGMHTMFRVVDYDLSYDDTHPAYRENVNPDGEVFPARKRRVAHNPDYVLYPPGCHDDHRNTVLKAIAKELVA